MKKLMKSFVILAVVAIALGSAGAVFAQADNPEDAFGLGNFGRRGGRGGRGSGVGLVNQNSEGAGDGLLHDLMIEAFAEKLNVSVEEIEKGLTDGKTMLEISGLDIDEFRTMMQEVHTEVREQAVADGLLPEFQADGINARRGGFGKFGGMRGQGQGLYDTGDCLND